MASVKSLGVHRPIGLRYAIEEGILPDDPPRSSYTWESSIDTNNESGSTCEDELLVTESCVIWSRGGLFRKAFKFDVEKEPVTQALLTYFPASQESEAGLPSGQTADASSSKSDRGPLSRALVVFLKTQAQIYFLSGTSHVVHMPFEVESACAAPCGVVIQRKSRMDNVPPVSLRLPKVPPNSFISSQVSPFSPRSSQAGAFSIEGLGKPKVLPLRQSLTLENMWQPPLETHDNHWPRLVCLTDPLLEIGLVVVQPEKATGSKSTRGHPKPAFLDAAEELIHLEGIVLPGTLKSKTDELIVAVTVNRSTNMYSVWRVSYLRNEDIFTSRQKSKSKVSRRRSSMAPALAGGATSPPPRPGHRDSFGATLPGKRSKRAETKEKALDNALNSLDPEKSGDATRRQSRRVSSLLARADLSASQDRSAFDQPAAASHGPRRTESHGSQRSRVSAGYGASFSGMFNHNLNSLTEAPVDNLLEELRAGGDFEGFHSMGLDDHDFDGLARELLFTKVHSINMDNSNVRYSFSSKPAKSESKVFVLVGPPCSADEEGKIQLLVGIQDPLDKRLQLITLYAERRQNAGSGGADARRKPYASDPSMIQLSFGQLRRAQSVVDSCKISDGDQSILILSEDKTGKRELSLQAPWSHLTSLELPLLHFDDLDSLGYAGRHTGNKEIRGRRSVGVGISGTHIASLRHSRPGGLLDFEGRDGLLHRIKIQLQPSLPLVRKALDACRSVLHPSYAEKLLAGWWHMVQWRMGQKPTSVNLEWSSFVTLLFASFLALGSSDSSPLQPDKATPSRRRDANWQAMQTYDAANGSAYAGWAAKRGWQWVLEAGNIGNLGGPDSFVQQQIHLAKQYISSPEGVQAFGPQGYMPTASCRDDDTRKIAASSIVIALHLLLEEQKLDIMCPEDVSPGQTDFRTVIWQLVRWLGWSKFETVYEAGMQADLDAKHDSELRHALRPDEPSAPCSIFDWIQQRLTKDGLGRFPTLSDVCVSPISSFPTHSPRQDIWASLTPRINMFVQLFDLLGPHCSPFDIVEAMHTCGMSSKILETLPEAILTPLQDAISISQRRPPSQWSDSLLQLINRPDISSILKPGKRWSNQSSTIVTPDHVARWDFQMLCQYIEKSSESLDEEDGSDRQSIVQAMFKEDRRLNEAQRLLSSNRHRVLRLVPKPEWSEAEYLEKQKELVTTMATSTLAIPSGRGMLYYALRSPLLTQKFHIGGFNLSCAVKPANNTVGVDKTLFTEEKINWAFFHQGVAGGLIISPQAKGIDTSWILYNKPGQDLSNRHAGFLLALGLNGHLKSVAKWVAFKYLTPKHTMTSIGLLLGLAASYIGTMDSLITRLLSVHVTRMLPRGSAELNLSKHTQTTGIMGIGLLYCNSQHRRMSEIMMSEIEYTDDEDEEDPLRDEGYRLAAGFALGFINLGKGNDLKGLHDMRLTEKLLTIATSTKKVELVHVLDRSAAGAVMAIAFIFMKSEDQIVARKIDVPESILQFDYIRPDILLLRTLAKNLILWTKIQPTHDWIKNSLPREYQWRFRLSGVSKLQSRDLPFFAILAGLCFAIGLRFAGSGNTKVRDLLVHYLDEFMRIVRLPPGHFDTEIARGNARMCMDVLALSCATVMAGTGDLVVLRRLRSLHGRDDAKTTYGSHMAAHLAIGAIFLGCGSITFDTGDLAIASLIVAFYPLFPTTVQDSRSHLQAFRHFWVLATDPRCLVTKDSATGQPIGVPVHIHLKPDSQSAKSSMTAWGLRKGEEPIVIRRQTPCLLPPLDDISLVQTDAATQGFWDLDVDFGNKPELLGLFRANQSLNLRRRPVDEGAFPATLRALCRGVLADHSTAVDRDPVDWVFSLGALKSLTHAERATVLDSLGSGGGVGDGQGASTAVDARLVLNADLVGWSRDRFLGLRLLFEWADRRALLTLPPSLSGPGGLVKYDQNRKREKSKSKKTDGTRDRKKVSIGDASRNPFSAPAGSDDLNGQNSKTGVWWIRDDVIQELKGKIWVNQRGQ